MLPSRPLHEIPGAREERCQELRRGFGPGNLVATAWHVRVEHHVVRVELAELREVARPQPALEFFHGFLPRAIFALAGMASAPSASYSAASRPAAVRTLSRTSAGWRVRSPAVRRLPPTIPSQSSSASATRWVRHTGRLSTASNPAPDSSRRSSSLSAKWTEPGTPQ